VLEKGARTGVLGLVASGFSGHQGPQTVSIYGRHSLHRREPWGRRGDLGLEKSPMVRAFVREKSLGDVKFTEKSPFSATFAIKMALVSGKLPDRFDQE
jgi:hypothetical protein